LCFQCDPTHIYNLKLDCTPTDDAPKPIEFVSADQGYLQTRGNQVSESPFESLHEKDLSPHLAIVREMHDFLLEQGKSNEAMATRQILDLMGQAGTTQRDLAEVWKRAERVRGGDAHADELTAACDAFRKREKEIAEAFDDVETHKGTMFEMARTAWAVATGTESPSALPFTYSDDIGQIGEHDVFFGGVELTQDVGEFKAGTKFACAVIDFQAGHLTLEEHQGREHRYDFALKVGAKHEGHTCTGCGSVVGQPCRQHA